MRVLACVALVSSVSLLGCGDKKPPKDEDSPKADTTVATPEPTGTAAANADAPKKEDCTGFDVDNLEELLNKSACEAPNAKASETVDMKDKLEVRVAPFPLKVAPGGKMDVLVTFVNKSKDLLPLYFAIDPTPRFDVEAYDAKGKKRVDLPAGKQPPPPEGVSVPPAAEVKTARVTLAANGTAKIHVFFNANKTKWAPEKVRGADPAKGYPRAPAGPLPKGKYLLRVVTPLVGVSEGMDKEVSAPKIQIEVGG